MAKTMTALAVLPGLAAAGAVNWQVSKICIKNMAGFVMNFEVRDLKTGDVTSSTDTYPISQTRCLDLKAMNTIPDGHPVIAKVKAILGKSQDVDKSLIYSAASDYSASYTCRGATLTYECTLDGYSQCDALTGTAATDQKLRMLVGDQEYQGRFSNWFASVQTCSPLMFPTNDAELATYLSYARTAGYKVRVTGATHSALGLTTQAEGGENTVVISLGRYAVADASWCAQGDYCLDTDRKVVRVNAGKSWLDLYSQIRPEGWFIPTQTAGFFFTIGGTVLGPVHGGVYGASFVHSYVKKMRVMLWDGSIQVLEGDDVWSWSSSYGLLGILTAAEIEVVQRLPSFYMYTKQSEYKTWNEENFWRFVAEDSEANLDLSFLPAAKTFNMTRQGTYGEFFLDFITDSTAEGKFRTLGVLWKQPEEEMVHLTKEQMKANYAKFIEKNGESVRERGAPKADIINEFLAQFTSIHALTNSPEVAAALVDFTYLSEPVFVSEQRESTNDGYWVKFAPDVTIAAYFVPFEKAFEAFDYQRAQARARAYGDKAKLECYRFNQPAEYRFVKVGNNSLLQVVPPGEYLVTEMLAFTDPSPSADAWQRAFAEVECQWTKEYGAIPHLSKLHSFGVDATDGLVKPGQRCAACRWFTDNQKQAFRAVRQRFDPHELFGASWAADAMLADCPTDCPAPAACSPKGEPDCGVPSAAVAESNAIYA